MFTCEQARTSFVNVKTYIFLIGQLKKCNLVGQFVSRVSHLCLKQSRRCKGRVDVLARPALSRLRVLVHACFEMFDWEKYKK